MFIFYSLAAKLSTINSIRERIAVIDRKSFKNPKQPNLEMQELDFA